MHDNGILISHYHFATLPDHHRSRDHFPLLDSPPHHRAGPPPTGSTVTDASPLPVAP